MRWVNDDGVPKWFEGYLEAFARCGRGENDASALLAYFGVPLVLSTDDQVAALMTQDQVVAAVQRQLDAVGDGYDHSTILDSDSMVLNATSVLFRATLVRHRADDNEIGRLSAAYLVTDGPDGRRISAVAVQTR